MQCTEHHFAGDGFAVVNSVVVGGVDYCRPFCPLSNRSRCELDTSSMSHRMPNKSLYCFSALGYCLTISLYSAYREAGFSAQNSWYPGIGTPANSGSKLIDSTIQPIIDHMYKSLRHELTAS